MKNLTISIISLCLLLTWCDVVSNISNNNTNDNNKKNLDLSTIEWRQTHCLQWIKDQIKSNSYSVSWDWESEDNWLIISDGLLEIDDWYYDVECSHEANWEWFNIKIMPIEEITYWESEDFYFE